MTRKALVKSITVSDHTITVVGTAAIARLTWTSESETDGKPTRTTIGVLQVWQQHGGTWPWLARQGFRTQATSRPSSAAVTPPSAETIGAGSPHAAGLQRLPKYSQIVAGHRDRPTGTDAAVYDQIVSGHQPGCVAGQEQRGLSNVINRPAIRQRLVSRQHGGDGRCRICDVLVRLIRSEPGALAEDTGGDRAGRQAVHTDTLFAQFDCCTAGHLNHGRLCGRVVMPAQPGPRAVDARNIDDTARLLSGHYPHGILHAGKDATHVHCDGGIELLQINADNLDVLRAAAGIVDPAVESAEGALAVVDHRLYCRLNGDIGPDEAGRCSERARELLTFVAAPSSNNHASAFGDEQLGRARANAARASSHNGDFAFQ